MEEGRRGGDGGGQPETANAIAAAIASGSMTARQSVERSLTRIEELDGEVNSCVETFEPEALAEADSIDAGNADPTTKPLLGVPVTVKEILAVRGARNTWGCPALAGRRSEVDDPYVSRLRGAGAIVVATTNVPELSCWGTTDNPVYGATRNPRARDRTPGGSSGGAAASVALGVVPLAIGSDAGGSIRIPASFTGVVGFKPSFSTLPADGAAQINRLNVVGPLARCVADARLALRVLGAGDAGHGGAGDRRVRVAATEDYGFAPVDGEVRDGFRAAIAALEDAGLALERRGPGAGQGGRSPLEFIIPPLECEVYDAFADLLAGGTHGLSAATVDVASIGARTSGLQYLRCIRERARYEDEWRDYFATTDVLLAPTTQVAAFPLGRNGPESIDGVAVDPDADGSWYPTSFIANVIGAPAASVPCGSTKEGLPIGLQVMGVPGSDELVLSVAERCESALVKRL